MKKFFIVLGVLVLAGVGLFHYLHGFDEIEITEVEIPAMNLVYVAHIGSYYGVGAVMNDLYKELEELGVEQNIGAGIYLDDPAVTPAEELRSLVGSVVSDDDLVKLEGRDFGVLKIKNGKGMMGEFPYKNMLSYMLAPMKVYPVMAAYIAKNEVLPNAGLEVYDLENKRIMIYMDLGDSYVSVAKAVFAE